MVALTVTVIVSGAIYLMLVSGQNAFRREPALTERQQDIRLAMDLIVRDVEGAGIGTGAFDSVFTDALDSPGSGTWPAATVAGESSDILELITSDGACPTLTVCRPPGANLFTTEPIPACAGLPGLGYVSSSAGPADKDNASQGPPGLIWLQQPGNNNGGCGQGHVNSPAGQSWLNPSGNYSCGGAQCTALSFVRWVQYRVAACGAASTSNGKVPCLWRNPFGGSNATGTGTPAEPPATPWEIVARGVEDLQVQYRLGTGWRATPGTPAAGSYDTIVRQVRVTLSARALAGALGRAGGGLTTAANGGTADEPNPAAVRGLLTSVVAPRAALGHLLAQGVNPRPSPNPWN